MASARQERPSKFLSVRSWWGLDGSQGSRSALIIVCNNRRIPHTAHSLPPTLVPSAAQLARLHLVQTATCVVWEQHEISACRWWSWCHCLRVRFCLLPLLALLSSNRWFSLQQAQREALTYFHLIWGKAIGWKRFRCIWQKGKDKAKQTKLKKETPLHN